ncbi:HIT family protein [Actinoplanes sp. NPDC023936]|uniref:HIT family protein n=1 Tax=Actinoplanes sp. NPDC023936 TaxID=3154910 RepID=UPI0033CB1FA4
METTTMDQWTPWPDDWPARKDGHECALCTFVREEDPDWGVRVYTGQVANGYLSVRGRIPGYCWVIWRDGHVCEPTEVDPADAQRFFADLLTVGRAVEQLLQPAKMNYSVLGNSVPHLHGHVVPRPHRDPAAGGPLPWEHLHEERRPADEVRDLTDRLRNHF